MRRLKKQLLAITLAAAMMSSLVPDGGVMLAPETVMAAETPLAGTMYQFNSASDWDDLGGNEAKPENRLDLTTERVPEAGLKLYMDVLIPAGEEAPAYLGMIKVMGVLRIGDNWDWVQSNTIPEILASDFTETVVMDGASFYKTSVCIPFEDTVGANGESGWNSSMPFADAVKDSVRAVTVQFAGYQCTYSGMIHIANARLEAAEQAPVLEEKEPTVLCSFDSTDDVNNYWDTEEGYQYTHGGSATKLPVLAFDENGGEGRLKVTLDYSADAAQTWSEAKVKYLAGAAADISNYNQISVDFIYPEGCKVSKMKFFADGVINKDIAIDESEAKDAGNGCKKVTVTMGFTPTETPLNSLTIGLIGVGSSFQGAVYLDNLTLSQKSAKDNYTEITTAVGTKTTADITKTPDEIILADAQATDSAKALYAYLAGLAAGDQVLFGHQNDISRAVNPAAEMGDVYDLTGSVSGIFGIDSLALTGSEAGGTDAASALANSIEYSKKAAENGAIVTLSAHMPNFTNSRIIKNEDGTYDFFNCDFNESKDVSNESVKKILPGGAYNEVFNAYLDIVAAYAGELEKSDIPVIFRPLHENTGSWFWWGSTNSVESYKSLFRYTRDYLESQGVHNMLYVYSPNGPLTSEEEYLTRYPGDAYVDIVAFDYYDDYNTYPATSDGSYFSNLDLTCRTVSDFAKKHNKLAAISECGVRVMKKDGSDNEGLLIKGNPVSKEACGKNWYVEVGEVAKKNDMPYYLVWANFGDTNFYVPYRYDDGYGQEMVNDFIEFYNDESSIFGDGTNFYNNIGAIAQKTTAKSYTDPAGYMVSPFDMDTVLEPATLMAHVDRAENVQFVITDTATGKVITLDAAKDALTGLYTAELTQARMEELGKTNVAAIALVAGGTTLATLENLSIGKEKESAPANVLEDFDYYSGSNGLLDVSYSPNSAAGCNSAFMLDKVNKADGTYGGAFTYTLKTPGSEVWTGRVKSALANNDFSAYNALSMWVKPDGNGQKLVVQLTDGSGEEFEVYLTDFVKGTEAKYVTVPFASFKGKKGGTLDTSNITKLAIWCNSYPAGTAVDISSSIYFDAVKAVTVTDAQIATADENGLIITDSAVGGSSLSEGNIPSGGNSSSGGNTPSGGNSSSGGNIPSGGNVSSGENNSSGGNTSSGGSDSESSVPSEEKPGDGSPEDTGKTDGPVTQKFVLTGVKKDTTATVTVSTSASGKKSVSASITTKGSTTKNVTKTTISARVVAQIVETAGTKDICIVQKVLKNDGKTAFTVRANASELVSGNKLVLVKRNTKTGEYTLVNAKKYKVTAAGNISVALKGRGAYALIDEADANALTRQILKTVQPEKQAKTLKVGKTTTIALDSRLNMENVSGITYATSKKSVATVSQNGKVTAKKAGSAVIRAKVALKNGKTRTVSVRITVKSNGKNK